MHKLSFEGAITLGVELTTGDLLIRQGESVQRLALKIGVEIKLSAKRGITIDDSWKQIQGQTEHSAQSVKAMAIAKDWVVIREGCSYLWVGRLKRPITKDRLPFPSH
jgi:hypothetical protein